jgi:predicted transcriptional regulator
MGSQPRPPVSEAEYEILRVLWDQGPATVRETQQRLQASGTHWQRSTVLTLLQRLEKKGFVASDRTRSRFVFCPTLTREELAQERMNALADEFAAGSPASLLLAFAERSRFTRRELEELREFIDDLLRKRHPTDTSKSRRGGGR